MEAFSANNSDLDLNPLDPHDDQHDADVDRHEQGLRARTAISSNPSKNGECGDMDNKNFGKEVFTRTYDPDFVTG